MHKMGNFRGVAQGVMARMLVAVAVTAGVGVAAMAPTAPALAAAAKPSNSQEFAKAAAPLQKSLSDVQPLLKKYIAAQADAKPAALADLKAAMVAANTPAELQAAEAGIKTPLDRLLAGQWGMMIGQVLGDMKLYQHALQNVVDSGVAPPEDAANYQFKLGELAYQNGDYAAAVKALTPLIAANYADDSVAEIVAVSYANLGQTDQAFAALKSAVDSRKAAGGTVPNSWFTRANNIAFHAKLTAKGNEWALLTAANNPSPENLLIAVQLLRYYNAYDAPESLDLSRLLLASGALAANTKGTQEEYHEYLAAADPRRYPGELLEVIKTGTANGALDGSATSVSEVRAIASKLVVGDRASLPAFEHDAHAPGATLKTVVGAADAALSYGEGAKAVELYQIALTKPGVDANLENSRLGIAQVQAGDYAGAVASFAKVEGPRKPLSGLWSIYAQSKLGKK
jgi:hypothetical protein